MIYPYQFLIFLMFFFYSLTAQDYLSDWSKDDLTQANTAMQELYLSIEEKILQILQMQVTTTLTKRFSVVTLNTLSPMALTPST